LADCRSIDGIGVTLDRAVVKAAVAGVHALAVGRFSRAQRADEWTDNIGIQIWSSTRRRA